MDDLAAWLENHAPWLLGAVAVRMWRMHWRIRDLEVALKERDAAIAKRDKELKEERGRSDALMSQLDDLMSQIQQ